MTIINILEFMYEGILLPLRAFVDPMIDWMAKDLGEALHISALEGVTFGFLLFAEGFILVTSVHVIKLFNPLS